MFLSERDPLTLLDFHWLLGTSEVIIPFEQTEQSCFVNTI